MATVFIPQLLRPLAGGAARLTVPGSTLRQVLNALVAAQPGLQGRVLDADGNLLPELFVAIGNAEAFGIDAAVADDDEVHLLPAIAGG